MAINGMTSVICHMRRAMLLQEGAGLTDSQLLGCFVERRDEAAFEALARRHGPMVLGVCSRVLHNPHDAEDAFQATFLVLARKAASVVPREMVANWLYGVAHQTAIRARALNVKRRSRERQVIVMPEPEAVTRGCWDDLKHLLDHELSRLPDKYRVPVVLCDLEGKTRKEAARQLGWPEGSVSSRLARARAMLAKRLTQRGVALSGGSLATLLSHQVVTACVSASLVSFTIKAATMVVAGQAATAGLVPAKVAALAEGVLKSMLLTKLKIATVGLLAACALAFCTGKLIVPTAKATAQGVNKQVVSQPGATKAEESLAVQVRIVGPAGMKVTILPSVLPARDRPPEPVGPMGRMPMGMPMSRGQMGPAWMGMPASGGMMKGGSQPFNRQDSDRHMGMGTGGMPGPPPRPANKNAQLEVPGRFNLEQGKRTRLKLAEIPNRPGVERFPTIEIAKVNTVTESFVISSAIPIEFLDDDFDRVNEGKTVTKVVYLATPTRKRAARQGEPITIASYDYPDRDVIAEAKRRGTILAVMRMGNIDLEAAKPPKAQIQGRVLKAEGGKRVAIPLGNDGIQGVVRPNEKKARANDKNDIAKQMADVMRKLEDITAALMTVRTENEVLKQRLQKADVETKSLRDLLERKERELQQMKKAQRGR